VTLLRGEALRPTAPTEELLEPAPWVGQRWDRYEYELLDRNLFLIGRLEPDVEASVPTITANSDSTTKRTLNGLSFDPAVRADVNPFSDRLRPMMLLENGERFPLGVYLFQDFQREPWQPQCADFGAILDQPTDRSVALARGADIPLAMRDLALELHLPSVSIEVPPIGADEPLTWSPGTSRWQVYKDLCAHAACLDPYFDNVGTLVIRPSPDPEALRPDWTYGEGRIVAQSVLETDNSYSAPNRYIVSGQSSTVPIVAHYDIPTDAPHSIPNRGYVVAETVDVPAVTDAASAVAAAKAAYVKDSRTYQSVTFESLVDPRHDLYAIIKYEHDAATSGLYLETGFAIDLSEHDGKMTHTLSRLWEGQSA
jgi:hypothetical protein